MLRLQGIVYERKDLCTTITISTLYRSDKHKELGNKIDRLTASENTLLCLPLQHGQVIQQGQHILWRLLDGKQWLQTW